jgi:hypothetical protein
MYDDREKCLDSLKALEIGELRLVLSDAGELLKARVREVLKPYNKRLIIASRDEYELSLLDYIWDLDGDRSMVGVNGEWFSDGTGQRRPYCATEIERYEGKRVRYVWGVGVIAPMKPTGRKPRQRKVMGIRVELACAGGCGQNFTAYARPGCHTGAFCYVYSFEGKFLADLRNQEFCCDSCSPKRCGTGRKRRG